jgi:hypothetical protein
VVKFNTVYESSEDDVAGSGAIYVIRAYVSEEPAACIFTVEEYEY